jgi:alpha-L-fucosidase
MMKVITDHAYRFLGKIFRAICIIFFLAFISLQSFSQKDRKNYVVIDPGDTEASIIRKAANVVPSSAQLRWQQLELTGFFHFGINTYTNREWGNGKEDPRLFDPSQLDARQWVRIAKDAGIRQVILTAKHHDGFCLWPTATTEHSVKSSPWKGGKGDVVKEVADACQEYGLGFGIYLSPWDMNASVYGTDAYNDFFLRQLTELLSNYGKVDEVWFDGANGEGPNGKRQVYDFDRWYRLIRKMQPEAVIAIMGPDVRWVGTETGYGRAEEWSVVPVDNLDQQSIAENSQQGIAFKPTGDMREHDLGSRERIRNAKGLVWYPAETDVSIRPGWFYHENENDKVKSPEKLLDIYFNSVGRNGVLLLNIPPDKKGLISAYDSASLIQFGKMKQQIFKENILKGAKVSFIKGRRKSALTDGLFSTYWTTGSKDTTAVIEFELREPQSFDLLMLQEDISRGQRIEKFVFEYKEGDEWKKITEGTTVGYKRLLQFPFITAKHVRLRILSSRLNPFISEIGLFRQ